MLRALIFAALIALASNAVACTKVGAVPSFDQRLTLEVQLARGFAAVIMDTVPDNVAWAMQFGLPGAATSILVIADDQGCAIAMEEIDSTIWDLVLSMLPSNDTPIHEYPFVNWRVPYLRAI